MTMFVVVLFVAALGFTGLILDGGAALAAKASANGIAQEAARAGAQHIDLLAFRADGTLHLLPGEATEAALQFLAAAGRSGTATVTGDSVEVTITDEQPTLLLGLIGIPTLTVKGSGHAQPR
ncbi:pilus assembly protein TadG-related protein [Lentzea sp. NPDC006480]|uniref:pilus assembly protein TadG-related protein n=1 Tax=Lentzea sp. NPDC006480 TaxID=3157176 RepID=UPI0033A6F690